MSKRKRDDDGDDGNDSDATAPKDYRRQRQMVDTFSHSAKQLAHAVKLAKGFERQKLGRRKKTAVRDKNDVEAQRIDAEVAALKTLDATRSASHLLAKSLLKIKAAATHPNLPDDIAKMKPVSTDTAALNVHARLCNSNPVKQALLPALAAIKREFGVRDNGDVPETKKRKRARDYAAQEQPRRSASAESGSDNGLDMEQFAGRLAPSEDDDEPEHHQVIRRQEEDQSSEAFSLSSDVDVQELERQLEEEGVGPKSKAASRSLARDRSMAAFDETEEESGSESEVGARDKASKTKGGAFLPSLSMGGYISGSDSEIEDIGDSKPKKNRRGQRARQAIWEKKYGTGAKHLQGQDRKQGWDAKRGAVDNDPRGKRGSSGSRFAKAANALPLGKNRDTGRSSKTTKELKNSRDDSGPLHPSWEAAKRAKEKKSVPVTFTGKKISFD